MDDAPDQAEPISDPMRAVGETAVDLARQGASTMAAEIRHIGKGEAESPIELGSVVKLRSGGARMTIREMVKGSKRPMVRTDWHDDLGNPIFADYYVDQLSVVDGEMEIDVELENEE
jgi:uncharacterized protein YodC (DUF2158 family)